MKINLVMIVKNEARTLARCLEAAAPLVDEMIVADTGSDDGSREIAARAGAKVFSCRWEDDFSKARNFALEQSDGDFNLVLDADEIVRAGKRETLEQAIRLHGERWIGAFLRYDYFPGRNGEVETSTTYCPRLLPRGVRYTGAIHEQPDSSLPVYPLGVTAEHDGYLRENKGERNLRLLRQAVQSAPQDAYYQFQLGQTLRNLGREQEAREAFARFYALAPHDTAPYRTEGVLAYLYTLLALDTRESLAEAKRVVEAEEARLGERADFQFVKGLFYIRLIANDTPAYIGLLPEIERSFLRCLEIGERPEDGGVVGVGSFKAAANLALWYEMNGQEKKAEFYRRMAERRGDGNACGGERK